MWKGIFFLIRIVTLAKKIIQPGLTVLYVDMRKDHVIVPGLAILRRLRRRQRPAGGGDPDVAGSVASTVMRS